MRWMEDGKYGNTGNGEWKHRNLKIVTEIKNLLFQISNMLLP